MEFYVFIVVSLNKLLNKHRVAGDLRWHDGYVKNLLYFMEKFYQQQYKKRLWNYCYFFPK